MTSRSLLSAGLFLGWCAVLLNGCGDDITADDDDSMGGGGSTNGGSSARGGMGGSTVGGSTVGGSSGGPAGGSSGGPAGGSSGGITFEPAGSGGMGGDGGALEGGDGGMPPIGQAGSSGDSGGGGMAGEAGAPGAAGGGGDWSMAGAPSEGGADDGMAGAAGGGAEPARTCANGCAEISYPFTAWGERREFEIPLGARVDLSTSMISVRLRVVEGTVGGISMFAKNGSPNWENWYEWKGLPAVGTWTTFTLNVAASGGTLVRTVVETIGLTLETGGMWNTTLGDVRVEVDSVSVTNAAVGPWDFTTSAAPFALQWTPPPAPGQDPVPGTLTWIQPEN